MSKRRIARWAATVAVLALVIILAIAIMAAPALAADGSPPTGASEVAQTTGAPFQAQQLWGLLVSIAVPFVTGILVRKSYSRWLKTAVAFVVSGVVAVVTIWVSGKWGGGAWAIVFACFGVGQLTFYAIVDKVPGLKAWLYGLLNTDPAVVTKT